MGKKILIHTRKLSIPGGKQTYLRALQPHFKDDVSYFYYGARSNDKESLFGFIKRFLGDFLAFRKVVRQGDYDLVHINTSFNRNSFFRDSIFAWISSSQAKKTLVFWHGWRWDFERYASRWLKPYFRVTFGKVDAMVCLSAEFKEALKQYDFQKTIFVETTVVEDHLFQMTGEQAVQPATETTLKLLFLARVEKSKGIYETIDGFVTLKKIYPHISLQIAGTGSELKAVKNYVSRINAEGIEFLGWLEVLAKTQSLHQSDIFILASYSEGMPIGVLEAMAVGKPVITTDVGGVADFFVEGKMGYLVEPGNVSDLTEKIEKLLIDPNLRTKMGDYNHSYARSHFYAPHVCEKMGAIYEEITNVEVSHANPNLKRL